MRERPKCWPRLAWVFLAGAALSWPLAAQAAGIDKQDFGQIEHGHYLAIVGDCAACHTLPGSGHDLAGGRPIETPFGELVAPNITPDPQTGIGAWTDDEFVDAMTKGTGRGGTHLYPAMPYTYYTKVTRNDALAIRAYLNALPAVHNEVNPDQLPFPLDIRISMTGWNAMFFKPGAFEPDTTKSPAWNRGAYLTEGLSHCGLCHTPKNILGGDKSDRQMQGYNLQGWFAPDITNDPRRGLGSWSVEDIATYLKTGHNTTSAATGLMAETLNLSTSKMSDDDLKAIAAYLKDRPGDPANQPNAPQTASTAPDQGVMKAGAQIYADECSGCHMSNGKGTPGLFPSLNGTPVVQQTDPATLMHVVLRGALGVGTAPAPTAAAMPPFAWVLNDDQVADVVTYIRNAWGNSAPAVSSNDVGKMREALIERSD
jgi:mono/diheme cytochrome c family protein